MAVQKEVIGDPPITLDLREIAGSLTYSFWKRSGTTTLILCVAIGSLA
jgi:hypothetical protein